MPTTDWEARYHSEDMPWEKGAPSPGLVDFLESHPELARGSVCVPGCGTGHDLRAWATQGYQVLGCDIAPTAVRLALERMAEAGLACRVEHLDFLQDEPPYRFDWLFEHTLFCAIDPGHREAYCRAVLRWLQPQGHYLAVNYLIPDTEGPPFGTTREEVIELFMPHFELIADWVPRSYPNRTGLERMFWWRRRIHP